MKKCVFMLLTAMMIVLSACEKSESVTGSMKVVVTAASEFSGIDLSDIKVTLVNNADNTEMTALTDDNGEAVFETLAPSSYNVSASKTISAEEADSFIGVSKEITLNGTALNVTLAPKEELKSVSLVLNGSAGSALVIKEIYSAGATNDSYAILFKDQFIEIYNNSNETDYMDGLYIAYLAPQACGANPKTEQPLGLPMDEYLYANKVLRFPGSGKDYPIEPGKSIVVALNAVNYLAQKPDAKTVDNSTADFETYAVDWLQEQGRTGSTFFDLDNPDVPNMKCIYMRSSFAFFNMDILPSIALMKLDEEPTQTIVDPNSTSSTPPYYLKMKVSGVLDAVDILYNSASGDMKRLPSNIDAGFYYIKPEGGGEYSGTSVCRKLYKSINGRNVLMDTNNSSNDFEIQCPPTPRSYNIK